MLAVTTRNVLRSARFCLPMLSARRQIVEQLARAPGLVRYAGGVVSPTEFLTLTVWEDKQAMRSFMQGGAHERLMWRFSQWSASFWGMRWEPTESEIGSWDGLRLSDQVAAGRSQRPVSPLVAAGLLPPNPPRAGPFGPRLESGAVEPRNCGLFVVVARGEGLSALQSPLALRHAFRTAASEGTDLVRWAVGLDWTPQSLAIGVWRDQPAARDEALDRLARQPAVRWAMAWRPGDYEIGHWDGLRLRLAGRRAAVS
jgi:hypothetical protein